MSGLMWCPVYRVSGLTWYVLLYLELQKNELLSKLAFRLVGSSQRLQMGDAEKADELSTVH